MGNAKRSPASGRGCGKSVGRPAGPVRPGAPWKGCGQALPAPVHEAQSIGFPWERGQSMGFPRPCNSCGDGAESL